MRIPFLCLAAFATLSIQLSSAVAQTPSPAPAGVIEHLIAERAVPGSYGGVAENPAIFSFPKGKYFVTSVFCSISGGVEGIGRIYIDSPDPAEKVPGYYINGVVTKAGGRHVFSVEPSTPLFLNNKSGKVRVRIELPEGYPVCQVAYLAYRY